MTMACLRTTMLLVGCAVTSPLPYSAGGLGIGHRQKRERAPALAIHATTHTPLGLRATMLCRLEGQRGCTVKIDDVTSPNVSQCGVHPRKSRSRESHESRVNPRRHSRLTTHDSRVSLTHDAHPRLMIGKLVLVYRQLTRMHGGKGMYLKVPTETTQPSR